MRALLCLVAVLWALDPLCAVALSATDVVLGFGSHYVSASGETRIHRGADIALSSGSAVESPIDGTVTFAGRVPGPEGGTVLAVTIDSDDGKVTLLPLQGVGVGRGDTVRSGQSIGAVAASGDGSSPDSHVHVSLRTGDLYRDPMSLLALPAPVNTEPTAEPAAAPAASAKPVSPTLPVAVSVASGQPALEIGSAPAGSPATVQGVGSGVARPATTSGPVTQPGVALAPLDSAPVMGGAAGVDMAGLTSCAVSWLAGNPLGLTGILFAAVVVSFVLTRRSIERAMCSRPPVSDRLGKMLQQLRAGDTLCGLISCSGHDAFTVPGPPAQRR